MASSDPPSDRYIFTRDSKSTLRLNHQHWLITQLCGYLLHHRIPAAVVQSSHFRVVDIGTGTCIWPIELSRSLLPSSRIDGFDISLTQFPPQQWLPSNLHLHTHDVFTPFPEEHLGCYDVIHLRFFVTMLNWDNLSPFIENLRTLLKPGGYLQWVDLDILSNRAIKPETSSSPTSATEKLIAVIRKPQPSAVYDWIPELCSLLSQHGFKDVCRDQVPMLDHYRPFWNQTHLMAFQEYCDRMMGAADTLEQGARGTEALDALQALSEEFRQGVSIDSDFFCITGQN